LNDCHASALPTRGFGGEDAYPSLLEKAAVLIEHLARNHPLPDGNKRAAFLAVWLFLEVNDLPFAATQPDIDVPMVERIAAGKTERTEIIDWLTRRTRPGE
jgi:death on curing protein